MNRWFDELGARWLGAARRRQLQIDVPELDSTVAGELLELARVTAHTQERRFAPLACYTAGLAVEQLRQLHPTLSSDEIAAYVREVWQELEQAAASATPG